MLPLLENRRFRARVHRVLPLAAALLLISPLLTSCSSSDDEIGPKEIPLSETAIINGPEQELFYTAKKHFEKGYYLQAIEAFNSVKDSYPFGPYAEFASIKIADSQFLNREFAKAAPIYEQFLKDYPSSESYPYALMRAGRSYQLVNTGLGRDQEPLEKALTLYDDFLSTYPQSMYSEQVFEYRNDVAQALADHEKLIAEFYKKQGKLEAYKRREEAYQNALAALDVVRPNEATQIAERSIFIEQNSNTEPPKILMASLAPSKISGFDTPTSSRSANSRSVFINGNTPAVTRTKLTETPFRAINCSSGGKEKITLEFLQDFEGFESERTLPSENGEVSLELPLSLRAPYVTDCFKREDLKIDTDGTLRIASNSTFKMFRLNNPPRLLIFED